MSGTAFHRIPLTSGGFSGFSTFSSSVDALKQNSCPKKLHNIAAIRRNQSISLAYCAKKLGISIQEAREQEQPTTDLSLSQLLAWKEVLEVPLSELAAVDELDDPVRNRAMMVKVMKTAKQIHQISHESRIRYMATNLIEQLTEIMPELQNVNAWPDVGQSHENREPGQAAFRRFDPEIARRLESY